MHEGKHGILDGVDDIDSLFGTDDKQEQEQEHEHEQDHEHEHECCDNCKK